MTAPEIELKVREIISKKFNVPIETIGPTSRLIDDLKVDSFGAVELMFELEEQFGLKIADSDIERVMSVEQIVAYLMEWLEKKKGEGEGEGGAKESTS
jgi:acyl carrier protein